MPKNKPAYVPSFEIDQIFSDDELADLLVIAHRRVVEAFIHATMEDRGKERSTGNVIYVEQKPSKLARYVTEHKDYRAIMSSSALPVGLEPWRRSPGVRYRMAMMIDQQLIAHAILELKHKHQIWYDELHCHWAILVHQIDQYRMELRKAINFKRQYRYDRRNEHGQVRSQRKRRGRPAGTSVSLVGPGSRSQAA